MTYPDLGWMSAQCPWQGPPQTGATQFAGLPAASSRPEQRQPPRTGGSAHPHQLARTRSGGPAIMAHGGDGLSLVRSSHRYRDLLEGGPACAASRWPCSLQLSFSLALLESPLPTPRTTAPTSRAATPAGMPDPDGRPRLQRRHQLPARLRRPEVGRRLRHPDARRVPQRREIVRTPRPAVRADHHADELRVGGTAARHAGRGVQGVRERRRRAAQTTYKAFNWDQSYRKSISVRPRRTTRTTRRCGGWTIR